MILALNEVVQGQVALGSTHACAITASSPAFFARPSTSQARSPLLLEASAAAAAAATEPLTATETGHVDGGHGPVAAAAAAAEAGAGSVICWGSNNVGQTDVFSQADEHGHSGVGALVAKEVACLFLCGCSSSAVSYTWS